MAKRRRFTPEFKAKVVLEALNVETSQAELCRPHNITAAQLTQWKRQRLENAASLFESTDKPSEVSATARIAHLEQLVGRWTQAVDIQKKLSTGLRRTGLKNDDGVGRCCLSVRCDRFGELGLNGQMFALGVRVCLLCLGAKTLVLTLLILGLN